MTIIHVINSGKPSNYGSAVINCPKATDWATNSGNYVVDTDYVAKTGAFNDNNQYNLMTYRSMPLNVTGTETVLAAVTDKSIEVLNYVIVLDAAATVMFTSDDDEVLASGMSLGANGGVSFDGVQAFKTSPGEALKMTVSTGNASGHITYRIV